MKSTSNFSDELKLFESLIAFGKKLVRWEIEKHEIIEYNMPIIVQLNRTIEIIQSIAILIKGNLSSTIPILLRSQVESYFYLSYLIEDDTLNRCLAYNYWHIAEAKKDYEKVTSGSELNKQLSKSIKKDKNNDISLTVNFDDYSKTIKELENKLSLPIYLTVRDKITELKAKNIKRPNWYQYFNEKNKNIKELSSNLGLHAAYDGGYRYNSKSTHSNDAHASYYETKNNNCESIVIESVIESSHFAIQIYKNYIDKRQNDKMRELSKWFYEEIESVRSRIIERAIIQSKK